MNKQKKEEIHKICKSYNIKNYTINTDMSIDVLGHVSLSGLHLTELPLKFGYVSGSFYCYGNNLETLKGSPYKCGEIFNCSNNNLTTLEHCPVELGLGICCHENYISDEEHMILLDYGFDDKIIFYTDIRDFSNLKRCWTLSKLIGDD